MQSKPSECKKGKAMYEAKIKKEKQTCEAKNNFKRKLKMMKKNSTLMVI